MSKLIGKKIRVKVSCVGLKKRARKVEQHVLRCGELSVDPALSTVTKGSAEFLAGIDLVEKALGDLKSISKAKCIIHFDFVDVYEDFERWTPFDPCNVRYGCELAVDVVDMSTGFDTITKPLVLAEIKKETLIQVK